MIENWRPTARSGAFLIKRKGVGAFESNSYDFLKICGRNS